jgi:hypothetical protein
MNHNKKALKNIKEALKILESYDDWLTGGVPEEKTCNICNSIKLTSKDFQYVLNQLNDANNLLDKAELEKHLAKIAKRNK